MEQAQKGHLSNHSEHLGCHDDCVTLTAGASLQHNCFPRGAETDSWAKDRKGQSSEVDRLSHHSMVSSSQKGLPSLTVMDEQ